MKQKPKVVVTERALLQRINRKLRDKRQALKSPRGRQYRELGNYYLLDLSRNSVIERDTDIEKLGRKLGVLQTWEKLKD
jgi:hypothetical protein